MRFSVIIATLGRSEILARTIASVALTQPPPHELIVIDGDEERSSEVSTRGEHPFPVRYDTAPRGLPKQRNAGIDRAEGDVIVFVDDDVELPTDTFEVLERVFADNGVLGATARIVEPASDRIGKKHSPVRNLLPGGGEEGRFTRYGYPRRLVDLETERDIHFMHGSFMSVRAEVAREVRFDELLPGYALAEDEDFSYRVSRRGRIRFVPELHVFHAKAGHGSRNARAFGRTLVVNRSYLFRKNFKSGPVPRLQFALLIVLFMAHRLVNREFDELKGLVEGVIAARSRPLERAGTQAVRGTPRVAFVSSHARAGGSEKYLVDLLPLVSPEAIGPVLVLEEGRLVEQLRSEGRDVRVVPVGGGKPSLLAGAWRVRRELRALNVDVVHANGVKAGLVCALARLRLPVVWVKHDFSYDGRLANFVAKRSSLAVGVSSAVLGALAPELRRAARVVHTGIEPAEVDRGVAGTKLRTGLEADAADTLIGIVGRMHPVKGHLDFVAAGQKVLDERPNARFVFVGGDDPSFPDHGEKVRSAARELGERAHFLGHRDDITEVIAGLDIGVMTSNRDGRSNVEALPLTALEMLACGTVVAAYASGGIPELLGECGTVVPTGDVDALARSIVALIDDAEERERLAGCGRKRVREDFSPRAMAAAMEDAYRAAVDRRKN